MFLDLNNPWYGSRYLSNSIAKLGRPCLPRPDGRLWEETQQSANSKGHLLSTIRLNLD